MGPAVKLGELWLVGVGGNRRRVLILTRSEVIDVRSLATVAEIPSSMRGLAAEFEFDHDEAGIDQDSVINCADFTRFYRVPSLVPLVE